MLENLKSLRRQNNLTQKELAQKLNVSHSNVSGWEKGKWQPDLESVIKICKLFGCSSDYLIGLSKINYKNEDNLKIKDPLEEELVSLFSQLDFGGKNQVIGYIKSYVNLQIQNKIKN